MHIETLDRRSDSPVAMAPAKGSAFALKAIRTVIATAALAAATAFATASPASADMIRLEQVSTGRHLDAWEDAGHDYRAVVWSYQNNNSQVWERTHLYGNVYTLQQSNTGRYLDAWEDAGHDWDAVTRPNQNNNTQRWIMTDLGGGIYRIQQVSSGRYLDAWGDAGHDWRAVTRPWQNNTTQQWRVTQVLTLIPLPFPLPLPPVVPPVHSTGTFELGTPLAANLDNGTVALFGGATGGDVNYMAPDFFNMQLTPIGGAQMSFTTGAQRNYAGCSAAAFSNAPVLLSAITPGDYICMRTGEGRISEFRINSIGLFNALNISYTTWQ